MLRVPGDDGERADKGAEEGVELQGGSWRVQCELRVLAQCSGLFRSQRYGEKLHFSVHM